MVEMACPMLPSQTSHLGVGSLDPGRKLVVGSRPQCGPGKVGQ